MNHDLKWGVYFSARLGNTLRNTNVHVERKWHTIHWQFLCQAIHSPWREAINYTRLSPTEKWSGERYKKTIVTHLRHYVANLKCDWDIIVQPLTYAYSTQETRPTNTTPLFLSCHATVLGQQQLTKIPPFHETCIIQQNIRHYNHN